MSLTAGSTCEGKHLLPIPAVFSPFRARIHTQIGVFFSTSSYQNKIALLNHSMAWLLTLKCAFNLTVTTTQGKNTSRRSFTPTQSSGDLFHIFHFSSRFVSQSNPCFSNTHTDSGINSGGAQYVRIFPLVLFHLPGQPGTPPVFSSGLKLPRTWMSLAHKLPSQPELSCSAPPGTKGKKNCWLRTVIFRKNTAMLNPSLLNIMNTLYCLYKHSSLSIIKHS